MRIGAFGGRLFIEWFGFGLKQSLPVLKLYACIRLESLRSSRKLCQCSRCSALVVNADYHTVVLSQYLWANPLHLLHIIWKGFIYITGVPQLSGHWRNIIRKITFDDGFDSRRRFCLNNRKESCICYSQSSSFTYQRSSKKHIRL
jgi:hypothetical protein